MLNQNQTEWPSHTPPCLYYLSYILSLHVHYSQAQFQHRRNTFSLSLFGQSFVHKCFINQYMHCKGRIFHTFVFLNKLFFPNDVHLVKPPGSCYKRETSLFKNTNHTRQKCKNLEQIDLRDALLPPSNKNQTHPQYGVRKFTSYHLDSEILYQL